jgi:hypothetical protein
MSELDRCLSYRRVVYNRINRIKEIDGLPMTEALRRERADIVKRMRKDGFNTRSLGLEPPAGAVHLSWFARLFRRGWEE